MAEQDINTCCAEGRSPASLCSRFTIWELGQLLWGGALGSLRDLALHARARAPGTPTRDVRDWRDERDAWLVYLVDLVCFVCLVTLVSFGIEPNKPMKLNKPDKPVRQGLRGSPQVLNPMRRDFGAGSAMSSRMASKTTRNWPSYFFSRSVSRRARTLFELIISRRRTKVRIMAMLPRWRACFSTRWITLQHPVR